MDGLPFAGAHIAPAPYVLVQLPFSTSESPHRSLPTLHVSEFTISPHSQTPLTLAPAIEWYLDDINTEAA